jgi:hypothetical protein
MDQIYRLNAIDKFYIWKDDSRMLSIKDISINNDSEVIIFPNGNCLKSYDIITQ